MKPTTNAGETSKKGDKKGAYGKQNSEAMGAKQGQMLKAVDDDLSQDKFLMAASSSSKGSAKY
jgi:hypothetical protein